MSVQGGMAPHVTLPIATMPDSSTPTDHPTNETLAAYIEAVLSSADRDQVNAHLDECEYCRSRLVLASHALETAPAPRPRRNLVPLAAGLLAAAGLAGVLLLSRSAVQPEPAAPPVRAAEETSLPPLSIAEPLPGASVDPGRLRFVWGPVSPDVLYQVTLSAADGRVLWTDRISDTVGVPPAAILRALQPGRLYFWRVDALLANLQSVTSGDQRFQVASP
jgi:hypothetical protein